MSVKVARVTSATAAAREFRRVTALQDGRIAGLQKGKFKKDFRPSPPAILQSCNSAISPLLQVEAAERRDGEAQRLIEAVGGNRFGGHASEVADVAAAVHRGVAVQQLLVHAALGHTDAVVR